MTILKPDELNIISHSDDQSRRYGAKLGALLQTGDVVCLSGDMGAGKTVFTSGIGAGWGSQYPVTSPTFVLVHEHRREKDRQRLYHLDCYRLENPRDAESLGFDDLLDSGAMVIEWAERIMPLLPPDYLWVDFRVVDNTRRNLIFKGNSPHYLDLIKRFREKTFGA
ncbi:MAG: tRNA (adenosine(37)-N6)-threonylcarbamoyltransferase complex ATPase subunit type 1 TsaE [Anaerolineae bacterium]|nr:tRNA (adenosine(37)-N6)-threonylcarbamoyltransferase complex ATPase subunit type 1 TsaE [Anaerolineae bacterium]